MLKSSKITGSVQEVILPDFPDDDNTVTTVTKSRRVSFGTNFVKEFIVGSAVSGQCMPEYEQAFPSSDSSTADSGADSGLMDHSMFAPHGSQDVQKSSQSASITSQLSEQLESRPKVPKFSSTVCFSADSPTADMEFTEGCISLAKSILDKKNKEMTVIIQAKPKESKEEDKAKEEETKYFEGSQFDMSMTRCLKTKGNKREEKRFEGEKTKIFSKYENEMSITRCNKIFSEHDSDESWEECKENRMPLDMIMRHLDKDNSDLNDLFNPEKTFDNFLNVGPFDFSNDSEKLNFNESMDISTDLPNVLKMSEDSHIVKTIEQKSSQESMVEPVVAPAECVSEEIPPLRDEEVVVEAKSLQEISNEPESCEVESNEPAIGDVTKPIEPMSLQESAMELDDVVSTEQTQPVSCIVPHSPDITNATDLKTNTLEEKSTHELAMESEDQKLEEQMSIEQCTTEQTPVEPTPIQQESFHESVVDDPKSTQQVSIEESAMEQNSPSKVDPTPIETSLETKLTEQSLDKVEEIVESPPRSTSQPPRQCTPQTTPQSPPQSAVQSTPTKTLVEEETNSKPSLVDVKVIESLKEQSREPGCVWSLKDIRHPQTKSPGSLSFNCTLLESTTVIAFTLKMSNENSLDSCSLVTGSEINMDAETQLRLPEYGLVIDFGYGEVKKFFEERRVQVETIRQVPYFLDQVNFFILKVNGNLRQIYQILTSYPGSRLEGSRLSFRLYSFPIFFSCVLKIDLKNLFKLTESSMSFEKDFGSFDENKIREIFQKCLKQENSLCEFVIEATKYLFELERATGCVTKRRHIRLLPAEMKI